MSQSDPENQAIAENQPADRQDAPALEQSQSVESVATTIYWQGSLPPPSMLQQYDDALPGAAERIMRMAEAEENHRIQAENRRIEQDDRRIAIEEQRVQQDDRRIAIEEQRVQQDDRRIDQDDRRIEIEGKRVQVESKRGYLGLAFGFAISLLLIAIGAYVVVWGNPWVGVAIIGVDIAAIAGIFVYGTNARLRASERKAADSSGAYSTGRRLFAIRLGGIFGYGEKRNPGESKILILTKTRGWQAAPNHRNGRNPRRERLSLNLGCLKTL